MNAGIESLRGLSGAGLELLQCPGWSALWCWLAAASRWLLSQSAPSWMLQGSWIRLWLWKAVVVHLFLKWNFWRFLCFKIAYLCLVHVISVFWLGVNWGSGGGIWFGVGHPGVFGGCADNRASFHLWWKKQLVKHQRVSKYYENDFLRNFLLHYKFWLTAKFVKNSHI